MGWWHWCRGISCVTPSRGCCSEDNNWHTFWPAVGSLMMMRLKILPSLSLGLLASPLQPRSSCRRQWEVFYNIWTNKQTNKQICRLSIIVECQPSCIIPVPVCDKEVILIPLWIWKCYGTKRLVCFNGSVSFQVFLQLVC